MIEVEEMESSESYRLLEVVSYAHLGCTRENRHYVVPVHYA